MGITAGILTYHDSDNFGSVLQAYALSRYLADQGIDVNVIDYRKKEVTQHYRIFQPMNSRYHIMTNAYKLLYLSVLKHGKQAFEIFRRNHLPLTDCRYERSDLIPRQEYSCYIAGSDQVWNINICDFDPIYMLRGIMSKKVSYAASFGPIPLESQKYAPYAEDIRAMDSVSVREMAGVELCRAMGIEAQLVCDPVFLLNKSSYLEVSSPCVIPSRYILCYFPGGVPAEMETYSAQLARETGADRILLCPEWRNFFRLGKKYYGAGPGEFLYLFQHAQCVCTSSFHGTALSVIMEKKCFCYNKGTDSRIASLLSMLRGVTEATDDISFISEKINKEPLDNLINASKEYLQKNIR